VNTELNLRVLINVFNEQADHTNYWVFPHFATPTFHET
jgi:hypothetical protein